MITQATISIIGVLLILVVAWGFYAVPARRPKGRALYALLLFFAIVHLVGDGFLRALADDPLKLSLKTLNTAGVFCYMAYLGGMIMVLQIAFDIVWVKTRKKVKGFACFILQLPSVGLIAACYFVQGTFLSTLLKYMPLLFALILFFEVIWYFEKLDRGLRVGLVSSIVGCILMFVVNSVFAIATLPMLVPVLLVVIAYSWMGRGELVISDVTEEELERLQEKGFIGVESEEEYVSEDGQKTKDVIYTDRAETEDEADSELEQMMMQSSSKKKERLSLDDELSEGTESAQPEAGETESADSVQPEAGYEESVQPVYAQSETLEPEPMRREQLMTEPSVSPAPSPVTTRPESAAPYAATGMQAVEPSPIDQIIAATVLTAESDSQQENAIQIIQNSQESVAETIHYRPLILEKDLNEYYHNMKKAVTDKDYDTCLEIMSEMSEYRISGIHVTRYERIRHAVVDEQWSVVEKELADF